MQTLPKKKKKWIHIQWMTLYFSHHHWRVKYSAVIACWTAAQVVMSVTGSILSAAATNGTWGVCSFLIIAMLCSTTHAVMIPHACSGLSAGHRRTLCPPQAVHQRGLTKREINTLSFLTIKGVKKKKKRIIYHIAYLVVTGDPVQTRVNWWSQVIC